MEGRKRRTYAHNMVRIKLPDFCDKVWTADTTQGFFSPILAKLKGI